MKKTLIEELSEKYGFKFALASEVDLSKESMKGKSITMAFKPRKEVLKITTRKARFY